MKQLTLFFSSLLFCFALNAQAPAVQWSECYGTEFKEIFYDIRQTSDGGYICAGHYTGFGGEGLTAQFWVVKLNSTGTVEWEVKLEGSDSDYAYSVIQLTDGSYVAVGETHSFNGDYNSQPYEYFWGGFTVVKISTAGEVEWLKNLGGMSWDGAFEIQPTPDNGWVIVGFAASDSGDVSGNYGFDDYWVVKMDSDGEIDWQQHYGGSSYDIGRSIAVTSDGGYIAVGESYSNDNDVSGNHGHADYWALKLSAEGNIQWQRCYGSQYEDYPEKIIQAADGGYAIIGMSDSLVVSESYTIPVCWVVRTDSQGDVQWAKQYDSGIGSRGRDIVETNDGGFLLVKEDNPIIMPMDDTTSFHLVKINSAGDVQWEKYYGGSGGEVCYALRKTSDGNYVMAGETWSEDGLAANNHGSGDGFVVKLGDPVLSIDRFTLKEYRIYPNPTSGTVQLEEFLKEAVIYNNNGRIVFTEANTDLLNLSSLPVANYVLHGTTESGKEVTARIIRK